MLNRQIITLVNLIGLICGACGSSADDASSTGSSTAAIPTLMQLQRIAIEPVGELFVLENGQWGIASQTTCSGTKGELTQAELGALQSYIADPALKTLPMTCSDRGLKLMDSMFQVVACWDTSLPTGPASAVALAKFFDDRIAELHWDGQPKNCEEMGPPALNGAKPLQSDAGSSPQRRK
jgi:hypothetical protein